MHSIVWSSAAKRSLYRSMPPLSLKHAFNLRILQESIVVGERALERRGHD